ncbi:MAG: dipeptide epimerase [Chitinophagaceae bacterium]|nr:dipeptide epimerase [Chitinophagaceae bacterium]
MKCTYYPYNLSFKHPFTISKGTKTHQPLLIVELEFAGIRGYGEAPAIAYYDSTVEKMIAYLESRKALVEKFAFNDPERYWHYLHHLLPGSNFLVCALDMAGWDLYGKLRNKPLYKLWNLEISAAPLTDYTIGIDTTERMVAKVEEMPWPIYKIKVGTLNDLNILKTLRDCTNAVIRVDANGGWTTQEALELLPQLASLGVELVEQPLGRDNWDGMKLLYKESPIPLIADESCVSEADVEKCVGHFHGVNIKLTKCSGITPALRMIKQARSLNMKLMLGCMNESTIGSAAIAHLAPLVDYLDMDGTLLLSEDIATGISIDNGRVLVSGEPGLGIHFRQTPYAR